MNRPPEKIPKMKIYISGPVTGTTDYIERFARTEKHLSSSFGREGKIEIFNPVRHIINTLRNPEELGWPFIMSILQEELKHGNYTHIYLMSGWEKSDGAVVERIYAKRLGMDFIYELDRE